MSTSAIPENQIAPLVQLNPRDRAIRETFQARGIRRPFSEWFYSMITLPFYPVKKGYQLLRSVVQMTTQPFVYRASSSSFCRKMDGDRLEKSRERLREIGGQTILLVTEDGEQIESMYFDVGRFRQAIIERGGQFLVRDDGKYVLRSYEPELTNLLKDSFDLSGEEISYPEMLDSEYAYEIELSFDGRYSPTNHQKQAMILTQGNSGLFEMGRSDIMTTLLAGQSCMVFNLRGTGRSHGRPNEDRSYKDIEAACQFLHSKGFSDSQITVQGYCLGSGMAVDLASRRPVHLILDRCFAKIGDVMADVVKDQTAEYLPLSEETKRIVNIAIDWLVPQGTYPNKFLT